MNKRWATLASNERNWRRSLSVFGPQPWPTAEKLDATATTLKKVGISKLLAALKGSVKAANEFVMQFGLQSSSDVVNTLSRLADHVRAIRAFEDDVVPARLLGSAWAGLSTPFEEITVGLHMRGLFLEKIGTVPHGRKVANRLVQLSPDFFAALTETRYMEAASEFLRTYDLVKSQLDNLTIEQCLLSCREEIAVMRKVLDLDPTGALTNINLTIGEIAERSVLMGRRDTLLRRVDASAVRDTARKWERTSELSDAIEAVQWVDALYRHAPPRHIQDLLLSGETAEIIQRFHVVASRGEELRRLYEIVGGAAVPGIPSCSP